MNYEINKIFRIKIFSTKIYLIRKEVMRNE